MRRRLASVCVRRAALLLACCGMFAVCGHEPLQVYADGEAEAIITIIPWSEMQTARTPKDFMQEQLAVADWRLLLANKDNPLAKDYQPETRLLDNGLPVDVRIYEPLLQLLQAGRSQGCSLLVCSAYRSYERQTELYQASVAKYQSWGCSYEQACELTEQTLAPPGTSEHQSGLAVDIVSVTHQVLNEQYENTKEGKWLAAHAHEYGFILRYPKDKADITKFSYEPWHFRYVGIETATEIYEKGCCLEEYIDMRLQ